MDNEAAIKHKLFLEEVKIMRLVYEEKARKDKLTQDEQVKEAHDEKGEWLKEHHKKVKAMKIRTAEGVPIAPEDLPLEQLKQIFANHEKIEHESAKRDKPILITMLILILVGIISYMAKSYLLLSIDLFVLVVWMAIVAPKNLPNPDMICPHCKTKGQINTKKVDLTKGISGGKAVAGLVTGGLSILAVGISRKETQTEARCGKCGNVWHF
jgi:hypothetical protein